MTLDLEGVGSLDREKCGLLAFRQGLGTKFFQARSESQLRAHALWRSCSYKAGEVGGATMVKAHLAETNQLVQIISTLVRPSGDFRTRNDSYLATV